MRLTIIIAALIVAAGLVRLGRQQPSQLQLFAADMLPKQKSISRADVIKAVERVDQAKLLSAVANPKWEVTSFHALDAKAALDGKSIGIFGEVTTKDGTRSPLNFSFYQDDFGRWVIFQGEKEPLVLPL